MEPYGHIYHAHFKGTILMSLVVFFIMFSIKELGRYKSQHFLKLEHSS